MSPRSTVASGARAARKEDRLGLRLSAHERALISEASAVASTSMSDFVLRSATAAAQQLLADRRDFRLSDRAWKEFVTALDRQPRPLARLARLLGEPSIFE